MEPPTSNAPSPPPAALPETKITFKTIATNAIRYWEIRRLFYNLALFLIVAVYYLNASPEAKGRVSVDLFLFLVVLAVLANVCYTAAYIVDVFVQYSGMREEWIRYRWILFWIGLGFAAILTRFFALGFFRSGS